MYYPIAADFMVKYVIKQLVYMLEGIQFKSKYSTLHNSIEL